MNQENTKEKTHARAVILDGSGFDDAEARASREIVQKELESAGIHYDVHILRDAHISPCVGCHQCWVKTPGECMMKDDQKKIVQEMAKADMVVMVTPITFGGYSSELKKSIDRLLPILLPFFRNFNGETHHPSRYGNEIDIFAIGTLPHHDAEKEQLFRDLILRNSLNMHSKARSSCIVIKGWNGNEIKEAVVGDLSKVIA